MFNSRRMIGLSVIALLALPLLAACGPTKVNVSLTTYAIAVDKDSIPAGDVIFHVTNDATDQKHEFVVVKTDLAADKLPLDASNNVDEEKFTSPGEVEDVQPGESKDLQLKLDAGHYVLICNTPGHYNQGMRLEFTVK